MAINMIKNFFTNGYDDSDDEYDDEMEMGTDDYSRFQSESKSNIVDIKKSVQPISVIIVRPEAFENAVAIADNLKEGKAVILNLENTDRDISRRLVDFLSGVAYATEGKIKQVAQHTFVIAPFNIDVLGDLIGDLGGNSSDTISSI